MYIICHLDYLLPNLDGLQLFDKLREKDKSVRAVLLTAGQELVEVEDIQDVIRKPIYPSKLVQRIRNVLNSVKALSLSIHSDEMF